MSNMGMEVFLNNSYSKINNDYIQNGTTLKIRTVNEPSNSFYQITSQYQVTYEYCSGNHDTDYFNTLILSPLENSLYTISMSQHKQYQVAQGLHYHDFYELMIVLDGNVIHKIGDREYPYGPGSCCLINRNVKHIERINSSCKLLYLDLSIDFINEILTTYRSICFHEEIDVLNQEIFNFINNDIHGITQDAYLDIFPVFQNTKCLASLHKIADNLLNTLLSPKFGASYLIKYLICKLIEYFSQKENYHIFSVPYSLQPDLLLFSRVQHLIEDTNGKIRRKVLETHFHYSANYITKIVKKYTGLSFYNYCLTYLLKKATVLLISTDKLILSIMEDLGFSNHTYFYKIFKAQYGVTPKAYREKYKHSEQ